jgi:hypothetical protein
MCLTTDARCLLQVWAGVDSVPRLVVPADMFEVTFHSDGSNNDWGFKVNHNPYQ